jgi:sulfite reductase beta subunit-like hemoprotein
MVAGADILATLDPLLVAFTRERFGNETFGDFCQRTVLDAARDGTPTAAVV